MDEDQTHAEHIQSRIAAEIRIANNAMEMIHDVSEFKIKDGMDMSLANKEITKWLLELRTYIENLTMFGYYDDLKEQLKHKNQPCTTI